MRRAAATASRATCSCRSTGCRRSWATSSPHGRPAGAQRPWLGVSTNEAHGRLLVGRVTPGGPAEKAGLQRGDVILGVAGEPATTMADFYRKVWAQGVAGTVIPIDVEHGSAKRRIDVQSINRLDHLKLKSTF